MSVDLAHDNFNSDQPQNPPNDSVGAPLSDGKASSPAGGTSPPEPIEPSDDEQASFQATIERAAVKRSVQAAAVALVTAHFAIARILPGEKRPTNAGWTTKSADPADFTELDNLGLLCGVLLAPHLGKWCALVCIDLDSPEAVARAAEYLPPTGMIDGRPGKPKSHWWYLVPLDSIPEWALSKAPQASAAAMAQCGHPGPFKKQFRGPDGKVAIDFIGCGGHATVPPSLHRSGELRGWFGGERGEPAIASFMDVWNGVCVLGEAIGCGPPSMKGTNTPRVKSAKVARGTDGPAASDAPETVADADESDTDDAGCESLFRKFCRDILIV